MNTGLKNVCRQLYERGIPLEAVANNAESQTQVTFTYAYTLYIIGRRIQQLRIIFRDSKARMAEKILSTPERIKQIEEADTIEIPITEIVMIAIAYRIRVGDLLELTPFEWYFDINWRL